MSKTNNSEIMQRLTPSKKQLLLSLLLSLALCLSACTTISSNCPAYPIAGEDVALELEVACGYNLELCPNIANWLDRVDKLKQQLEVCK